PHHHGRPQQGSAVFPAAGADAGSREDDLHDRRRRSCDRRRAVRGGGHRGLWRARDCRVPSARARSAWGRGAALARLRLVRSVPQLRGSGRSVQGARAGACVTASAVAGARVARQRAEQLRPVLRYDPVLLAAVLLLLAFGVVMVYSASAVYAGARLGDPLWFLKRQAAAALVGLVALLGAMRLGYRRLEALVVPLVFVSLALLLMLEPDVGTTAVLGGVSFALLFTAGARLSHLLAVAGAAAPVLAVLIWKSPYRIQRILAFLDPWKDPRGHGYQTVESLLAF